MVRDLFLKIAAILEQIGGGMLGTDNKRWQNREILSSVESCGSRLSVWLKFGFICRSRYLIPYWASGCESPRVINIRRTSKGLNWTKILRLPWRVACLASYCLVCADIEWSKIPTFPSEIYAIIAALSTHWEVSILRFCKEIYSFSAKPLHDLCWIAAISTNQVVIDPSPAATSSDSQS